MLHIFCRFRFSGKSPQRGWSAVWSGIYVFICGSDRQPHFIQYKLNVAACRHQVAYPTASGWVPSSFSMTLFFSLSFIHFLKKVVLITHRRWYLGMLTEIKKEQMFFGNNETSKWWLKQWGLSAAPRGLDLGRLRAPAPHPHLNIFKWTSHLKPD